MLTKGTIVHHGDVIIGKREKLIKEDDSEYAYADRSIVYKGNESAIVENVIHARNQNDNMMCKVIFRSIRPVTIGDKFSSRAGQLACNRRMPLSL